LASRRVEEAIHSVLLDNQPSTFHVIAISRTTNPAVLTKQIAYKHDCPRCLPSGSAIEQRNRVTLSFPVPIGCYGLMLFASPIRGCQLWTSGLIARALSTLGHLKERGFTESFPAKPQSRVCQSGRIRNLTGVVLRVCQLTR